MGYKIKLLAPSGYVCDLQKAQTAFDYFTHVQCQVLNPEILARRCERFAGADVQRLADWRALISDPVVPDIVLAIRGGYGAIRLLDQLNYAKLKGFFENKPIVLVGHSDFTAIQCALLSQAGIVSFSGPMLSHFSDPQHHHFTLDHFWRLLSQPQSTLFFPHVQAESVDVSGTLWGGNLSTLISLIGTPYLSQMNADILFIEDVNEPFFKIERMLYQLYLSGILQAQKAILFGQFTESRQDRYDQHYDLERLIAHFREKIKVPILTGLPVGHIPNMVTLPIGGHVRVVTNQKGMHLFLSNYPYLGNQ